MNQKAQTNRGLIGYNFLVRSVNLYSAQKSERATFKPWGGDEVALLYLIIAGVCLLYKYDGSQFPGFVQSILNKS